MLAIIQCSTGFWCRNLGERDHLEDPGVDERIILKWTLKEEARTRAVLLRLRIGTGGGLL
jgi:hypothetical protein